PYIDSLLKSDVGIDYLILFANNKELRPGGGFIGSFGVMTVKNYTIEQIKIYDVYDADGQLQAHIEPPYPIRLYLQQPNWFLRDSAFSPDFLENYAQAKTFLEREMNFTNFSGGILLTTTAIENILEAVGDVYLPDFKDTINKKNFYLKTQLNVEQNFFPGSLQKKNYLASLTRQLLLQIENIPLKKFVELMKKSLDEKQIVIMSDEPKLQSVLDSFYWSGRLIQPKCSIEAQNCIADFLFPYDANVGVNKANFFVNRLFDLQISIDEEGIINHVFSIRFKNESLSDIFPGGAYRNYFQLILPKNATVKNITRDGVLVEGYDEQIFDQLKRIGFLVEVKPQNSTDIVIRYETENQIQRGRNIYQVVFQKQIGSANNEFFFKMTLPKNIQVANQNFSPLVKDNQIIYNTSLSADKIFLVELIKE
ncbi:DUF4012 domain-containing protein, partial [Candidatus Roizmanbacteria bacterium]|nr:DUF4012 domain-containing protein [Candidatus Roizmanbacteria bacterium]